ncbi:MAG: U32 family peptidase [Roseburia sp.]|nr:U32 family peptidase [Roseburia sp.]MCM1098844.1 U32 family peptidase [Ruminococcus flavefaciens]
MRENRIPELLAPAGNTEAFYGAVHAGADAVYLGGSRFGARAYAENFTTEEILQCIRYGHLLGRKVYLTVNTLLRERELEELPDWLRPFCEAGLDAVIVQDFGALRRIRECFPKVGIHASTQMTLCSRFGARLLKEMGASRIVPARELSLEELRTIRSQAEIELETFVHGAMCYCYSGQCLFSSILGGRSGNRGRCAQPCRLPYRVRTKEGNDREGYYLSLKDLCTVEHLPRLVEAGIDSFKIEGRMKRPEYAAGVTAVYRKYLDQYRELSERFGRKEASERFRVEREDRGNLGSLYIRSQVQDGYYFKRNGADMVTLEDPSYGKSDEQLLEAIRRKYLSERKRLPVILRAVFRTGGQARLTLECGDCRAEVFGERVEAAKKQPVTEENLRRQLGKLGDSAFSLREMEITLSGDAFYPLQQINELRRRGIQELEEEILRSRGYEAAEAVQAEENLSGGGQIVEASAQSQEMTSPDREQTAGVLPRGQKETETAAFFHENASRSGEDSSETSRGIPPRGYTILAETEEQLQTVVDWLREHPARKPACVYVSGDLLENRGGDALKLCEQLSERCPVLIALPYIFREADQEDLDRLWRLTEEKMFFAGFLVRSADELGYLRSRRDRRLLFHLDANVYTWNRQAVAELAEAGVDSFCLPLELNAGEQRRLLEAEAEPVGRRFKAGDEPVGRPSEAEAAFVVGTSEAAFGGRPPETGVAFEKIVYGRIPMMVTANCVLRTSGKCKRSGKDGGEAVLIDRYNKEFPVAADCRHCMNVIYNSVPLSLYRECDGWKERARLRLQFTVEGADEVRQILDAFLDGKELRLPAHTAGHEKRGAE